MAKRIAPIRVSAHIPRRNTFPLAGTTDSPERAERVLDRFAFRLTHSRRYGCSLRIRMVGLP